eukprot:gene11247-3293_t
MSSSSLSTGANIANCSGSGEFDGFGHDVGTSQYGIFVDKKDSRSIQGGSGRNQRGDVHGKNEFATHDTSLGMSLSVPNLSQHIPLSSTSSLYSDTNININRNVSSRKLKIVPSSTPRRQRTFLRTSCKAGN